MKELKASELIAWVEAFAVILSAPKIRIGNTDFVDLRGHDVSSRVLEASHEMGWQVVYNKANIDERQTLVCFTEMTYQLISFFYDFILGNKKLNKPEIEPLFREASAIERV